MQKTYPQKVARFFEVWEYILLLVQIGFYGFIISSELRKDTVSQKITKPDATLFLLIGMFVFTILLLVIHSVLSRRALKPGLEFILWIATLLIYTPISLFILYLEAILFLGGFLDMRGVTIGSWFLYLLTAIFVLTAILPITVIYSNHKLKRRQTAESRLS